MLLWLVVPLLAPLLVVALSAQAPRGPISTEFRVFDGTVEVTASTRLRVTPAGRRDGLP